MAAKATASPADRISSSFAQLADSAARLNSASDELSKAVAPIDAALKKLNLGVTAWHPYINSHDAQDGSYYMRRVGYAKVSGKWGLALSIVSGYVNDPEDDIEQWLFNDAPRWMRIEAVDHIPALLEELVRQADKVAVALHEKSSQARELAVTLGTAVPDARGTR